MEGLERWDNLWKELERHQVMGEEGLVEVIESLVKHIVEAIYWRVCAWIWTHHAILVGGKRVCVLKFMMEIDGLI
jgi:hypothetical protein